MPSLITHHLIARKVLRTDAAQYIERPDAFLIGALGPDILFFHRVFPWQIGKPMHRAGVALHTMSTGRLLELCRALAATTYPRDVAHSVVLGILCHYAGDRTLHPYVRCVQRRLQAEEPDYAKAGNLYHHRIESMLDGILLAKETGRRVRAFPLTTCLPGRCPDRDRAIGSFYQRLIPLTVGIRTEGVPFDKLVDDLRTALILLDDRSGMKRAVACRAEKILHTGALLSPLLRTVPDGPDYANFRHNAWNDADGAVRHDDALALFRQAVSLSVSLIEGYERGVGGKELACGINFAGERRE